MIQNFLSARLMKILSVFAVLAILSGCASSSSNEPGGQVAEVNDPIEGVNRYFFEVNLGLDKLFFRPIAEIYREVIPDFVQDAVRSFLNNLRTPVIRANDLLQGEFDRAWDTVMRFGINSTAGGLGFYDLATDWGYPRHDEDFGQTLAVWGMGEGPYLMLPILGPSNPRDALGRAVDFFLDPLNWYLPGRDWAGINGWGSAGAAADGGRTIANAIDSRARNIDVLDDIERNSLDFYATIRSLYRQRRNDEIRNGEPTATTPNVPSISQLTE